MIGGDIHFPPAHLREPIEDSLPFRLMFQRKEFPDKLR